MKLFSDCGGFGQCYTCCCGSGSWGKGGCLAGIGDDDENKILLKFIETLKDMTKIPKDDCKKCMWCKEITGFRMPIMDAELYYCTKYECDIERYGRNNPTGRITPCYRCECDQKKGE